MSARSSLGTLIDMLTYGRPHGSAVEAEFIARYVATLPGVYKDPFNNYHVTIGAASHIWSCHTDTVHWTPTRQTLHIDGKGLVGLSKRSKKSGVRCLGADDTTGVWLCCAMIDRGVSGHYIFHYGEEKGGIGSSALAQHRPDLLGNAQVAIAFDRRGYDSVVTYQSVGRTCSDAFASALASLLGGSFKADDTGLYTDTAEYAGLIAECSNISVGYHNAHSSNEVQDTRFALALLETLCTLDVDSLPISRERGDYDQEVLVWESDAFDRIFGSFATREATASEEDEEFIIGECLFCDREYEPDESDATEPAIFCSASCELLDADHYARRRSSYLNTDYADVQDQLREDMLRRRSLPFRLIDGKRKEDK